MKTEIVDEKKDKHTEVEVELKKEIINLKDNVAKQRKCIIEKGRRITKIEDRWNKLTWFTKWSILSSIVGLFAIAISWMIIHLNNLLPENTFAVKPTSFVYVDTLLVLARLVVPVLAIIGFVAIVIFFYMWFHEVD